MNAKGEDECQVASRLTKDPKIRDRLFMSRRFCELKESSGGVRQDKMRSTMPRRCWDHGYHQCRPNSRKLKELATRKTADIGVAFNR